jgi:hypothetical protein
MNMLVTHVGQILILALILEIGIGVQYGKELKSNIFAKNQYHH